MTSLVLGQTDDFCFDAVQVESDGYESSDDDDDDDDNSNSNVHGTSVEGSRRSQNINNLSNDDKNGDDEDDSDYDLDEDNVEIVDDIVNDLDSVLMETKSIGNTQRDKKNTPISRKASVSSRASPSLLASFTSPTLQAKLNSVPCMYIGSSRLPPSGYGSPSYLASSSSPNGKEDERLFSGFSPSKSSHIMSRTKTGQKRMLETITKEMDSVMKVSSATCSSSTSSSSSSSSSSTSSSSSQSFKGNSSLSHQHESQNPNQNPETCELKRIKPSNPGSSNNCIELEKDQNSIGSETNSLETIGCAMTQGLRQSMEDFIRIVPELEVLVDQTEEEEEEEQQQQQQKKAGKPFFVGLYDGHNGEETSKELYDSFHVHLSHALQTCSNGKKEISEILKESFLDFDLKLLAKARSRAKPASSSFHNRTLKSCKSLRRHYLTDPCNTNRKAVHKKTTNQEYNSGSTATILLGYDEKITLGWLGDSRAVLCRDGQAHPLSTDHRAVDPKEKARIIHCGGAVSSNGRLFHDINLSRAFASFKHKLHSFNSSEASSSTSSDSENQTRLDRVIQSQNPLSAVPEVVTFQVQKGDRFVIVASDGLWDVVSNDHAVELVEKYLDDGLTPLQASEKLVSLALDRASSDNISVVVVLLQK